MSSAGLVPMLIGLAVAGLTAAQVDLPADFAARAERVIVSGFGGHNKGKSSFTLRDAAAGENRHGELATALTLAVLRDPANSALED
jgi:hypothetical protein